MVNRLRTRKSPSRSMAALQFKLKRIVSSHEQMKAAFHQLKAQIKFGLLQADDVFASLSIPLMRLVGLKTGEMAEEGRFSTIVLDADSFQGCRRNGQRSEIPARTPSFVKGTNQNQQIRNLQEESYTTKATIVSKEVREKQQLQLTQLVHLLRQIETRVNCSQNYIFQTIADHRLFLHKFFQKAISYISTIHRPSQNQDTILITLKLLQIIFDRMNAALGSVESGVEKLMLELGEEMCNPMVEYVKSLKAEMTNGTCCRLLATVEEMAGVMREGKLELEDARKKVRMAEETKVEALIRLEESEERVRKMKEYVGSFLLEAKNGSMEHNVQHKFQGVEKGQRKDEKPLWELMKKKRKCQTPDSPLGAEWQLYRKLNNKARKSTRVSSSINYRPVTRSYTRGLLGSSPSAVNQQVLSRKHITP